MQLQKIPEHLQGNVEYVLKYWNSHMDLAPKASHLDRLCTQFVDQLFSKGITYNQRQRMGVEFLWLGTHIRPIPDWIPSWVKNNLVLFEGQNSVIAAESVKRIGNQLLENTPTLPPEINSDISKRWPSWRLEFEAFVGHNRVRTPEEYTSLFCLLESSAKRSIRSDFSRTMMNRCRAACLPPDPRLNKIFTSSIPQPGVCVESLSTGNIQNSCIRIVQADKPVKYPSHYIFFKLSKRQKNSFNKTLKAILKNPKPFYELVPSQFCAEVVIQEFPHKNAIIFHFKGVGKVLIGRYKHAQYSANRISMCLETGRKVQEAPQKLHVIASLLGLGPVFMAKNTE